MALGELFLILGSQENSREASLFLGHIDQWHANTPGCWKKQLCIEQSGMRRLSEIELVSHCSAGKEQEHEKPGEAGPATVHSLCMEVAVPLSLEGVH